MWVRTVKFKIKLKMEPAPEWQGDNNPLDDEEERMHIYGVLDSFK